MCRYVLVSMLIAPLVGPVLAASCGLAMRDAALLTRGARSFVALLALTVSLGAFVGVALTPLAMQGAASALTWPTEEMATHGVWIVVLFSAVVSASGGVAAGLAVAAPWAVPSVVATALTASLIPPAVNAGLCARSRTSARRRRRARGRQRDARLRRARRAARRDRRVEPAPGRVERVLVLLERVPLPARDRVARARNEASLRINL